MSNKRSTAELTHFPPFDKLSAASELLLGRGLRYAQFEKTTTVLNKGEAVSGAYVVTAGQLRVYTLSPSGQEATLYLIDSGEACVLALNCIFNHLLYPAWVEAKPNTHVAVIPGVAYRALFEAEPAVRNMTVQAFSTIVFRLMAELEQVHSNTLEQRLVSFLLLRAATNGTLRMTQQQIAAHLGTTREVVARIVGELVVLGYLATGRGFVTILAFDKLAARRRRNSTRVTAGR